MAKDEKFLVHPDAVRGYASLLERNLGYLREMRAHNGFTAETRGLQGIMIRWTSTWCSGSPRPSAGTVNVVRGLTELNPHWDGNAAQAFDAHMSKWNVALTQNQTVRAKIRDFMAALAHVAKEFLQAAIDVVEMLLSLLGGGLMRAILKALKFADVLIKMIQMFGRIKKAVNAAVWTTEMIVAGHHVEAPETRGDVPEVSYGGPQAPGTM